MRRAVLIFIALLLGSYTHVIGEVKNFKGKVYKNTCSDMRDSFLKGINIYRTDRIYVLQIKDCGELINIKPGKYSKPNMIYTEKSGNCRILNLIYDSGLYSKEFDVILYNKKEKKMDRCRLDVTLEMKEKYKDIYRVEFY